MNLSYYPIDLYRINFLYFKDSSPFVYFTDINHFCFNPWMLTSDIAAVGTTFNVFSYDAVLAEHRGQGCDSRPSIENHVVIAGYHGRASNP